MAGSAHSVFAIVVIAGLFVLAVRLGDIPVQALAAAGAFENTGQDVCVFRVMYFFPLKGVDFPFLLG